MPDTLAIHRKPMKAEIYDILHQRIIAGQYASGQWLRQEEISSQLGVSMTPVLVVCAAAFPGGCSQGDSGAARNGAGSNLPAEARSSVMGSVTQPPFSL